MLLSIYWEGYATLLVVLLLPYYVFVLLKYFRRELLRLVGWPSMQQQAENNGEDEETDEDVPGVRVAYVNGEMGSEVAEMGKQDASGQSERGALKDTEKKEQAKVLREERPHVGAEPGEWQPPSEEVRSLLSVAQELVVEVKDFIGKAAKSGTEREELIIALQVLLDKESYRALRQEPFRKSINNVILLELANKCSIQLDAGELERLWVR